MVRTDVALPSMGHLVLRIRHDCPVSLLSRELPDVDFFTWSIHEREIVYATAAGPRVEAAVARSFRKVQFLPGEGGLAWTHASTVPKSRSISWQLERSRALWMQPLRCRDGWEYFDVIALDHRRLAALVERLRRRYGLEVVKRGPLSPASLTTSFFVPLAPVVRTLTPKQSEALRRAAELGYYEQPRGTTTRGVAASLGISRSALEERLRNAENAVLSGVVATLPKLGVRSS